MAKRRAQQQQAPGAPRPEGEEAGEEEPEHVAETSEIERYLESIGVKIERRAPAPAPRREPPPPPKRQPAILRPVETKPYESPGDLVVEEAPPPPPRPQPRPAPVPVRQEAPRSPSPRPLPSQPRAPAAPAPAERPSAPVHASAALSPSRPALPVLGTRPDLSDLRRAVILTEVLRRPNFERLPFERDPF